MKSYKQAFITGCDDKHEWLLPWFFENYKKHNDTPLVFADFGLSKEGLELVKKNTHAVMNLSKYKGKGWFLKPKAMLNCPAENACWIDTDCEVLGKISDVFKHLEPEKLSMVQDHPWTERRKEIWYNSGVVAFSGKPHILRLWERQIEGVPGRGDQEVLHEMLNPITKLTYIKDLPHRYNVLRLDVLDNRIPNKPLIMHWTGNKGKDEIRRKINA